MSWATRTCACRHATPCNTYALAPGPAMLSWSEVVEGSCSTPGSRVQMSPPPHPPPPPLQVAAAQRAW